MMPKVVIFLSLTNRAYIQKWYLEQNGIYKEHFMFTELIKMPGNVFVGNDSIGCESPHLLTRWLNNTRFVTEKYVNLCQHARVHCGEPNRTNRCHIKHSCNRFWPADEARPSERDEGGPSKRCEDGSPKREGERKSKRYILWAFKNKCLNCFPNLNMDSYSSRIVRGKGILRLINLFVLSNLSQIITLTRSRICAHLGNWRRWPLASKFTGQRSLGCNIP